MKIAVYCTGFLRTFKTNIHSLKKYLLDQYDCDLYFYVISNEYECDSYINSETSIDLIQKECNPKCFIIERENCAQNITDKITSIWFKLKMINELRKNIEKKENIKYDYIIKLRPDILLLESIDKYLSQSNSNCVKIPFNDSISYPENRLDMLDGVNDQFAIGPAELMDKYCECYDYLEHFRNIGIKNSSSILKAYLLSRNVTVEKIDIKYKLICKENIIITIAGNSGSGKTTLAKELKNIFETLGKKVLIFECDRYHKWERGDINWKKYTHLHPEANNLTHCDTDIIQLKGNLEILQKDYNHNTGKFTDLELIIPCPIIIVIGLHALYSETLNKISDCKIFLNPSLEIQTEWKLKRDIVERGYKKEEIVNQINKRYPNYLEYIQPQINNADIVINIKSNSPNTEGAIYICNTKSIDYGPECTVSLNNLDQVLELIKKTLHSKSG